MIQENGAMDRYIYEMAIPSEISVNTISPGKVAPAMASTSQKPKSGMSADDALSMLKLVNVGRNVLDTSSLKKNPAVIVRIAQQIIDARKTGTPGVEFENGRISISEDLFNKIVSSSGKNPEQTEQISNTSGNAASAAGMFAQIPPEIERTRKKGASKEIKSEEIAADPEKEADPQIKLSSPQAYFILIDIVPPKGGRYIVEIKEKFGDEPEEQQELETGLQSFWKDFGNSVSVNARHSSFTIEPKILVGGFVNPEVSKKLVWVYVSQSTEEKMRTNKIEASGTVIILRPSPNTSEVTFSSEKILNYLMEHMTTHMDSGDISVKSSTNLSDNALNGPPDQA